MLGHDRWGGSPNSSQRGHNGQPDFGSLSLNQNQTCLRFNLFRQNPAQIQPQGMNLLRRRWLQTFALLEPLFSRLTGTQHRGHVWRNIFHSGSLPPKPHVNHVRLAMSIWSRFSSSNCPTCQSPRPFDLWSEAVSTALFWGWPSKATGTWFFECAETDRSAPAGISYPLWLCQMSSRPRLRWGHGQSSGTAGAWAC